MPKSLAVISGAGASFDLVPDGRSQINNDFKPPLSKHLFSSRGSFAAILNKYPKARGLSGLIKIGIEHEGNFEKILKDLESNNSPVIQNQLLHIPLYIQELIGEVSEHYTKDPLNYNFLITKALKAGIEKIVFITLNYDTFIEKAIWDSFGEGFPHINSYCNPDNNWMVLKLHGSINWGHPINRFTISGSNHDNYLQTINAIRKEAIGKDIILLRNHQDRFIDNIPYYPAMIMPIEGKYEYVCPEEHITNMKKVLGEIDNFLIIGTSGKDQDLIDFLNDSVKRVENLHLIDSENADVIFSNLRKQIKAFGMATSTSVSSEGFSNSVVGNKLEFFMERIAK